jgi:MFS superfamily sulfate permease-like transporter
MIIFYISSAGFTTGAGVQIIIGQLPTLFGVKGVSTTNAPFEVLIDFFKSIKSLKSVDTLFGLTSLALLLILKFGKVYATKRVSSPTTKKVIWYIGLLANGITVLLFTLFSFVFRNPINGKLSIVGYIPKGLSGIQQPVFNDSTLISTVLKALPAVFIVSVLELVAIAKSFGTFIIFRLSLCKIGCNLI